MLFSDRLAEAIKSKNNPTVVGLDPKLEYLPAEIIAKHLQKHGETLEGAAQAIYEFNSRLLDALADIVPAVKLQSAFYEAYGYHGMKVMADTVALAKAKGLIVICDGKRNDIGSTAQAYSSAFLGVTAVGPNKSMSAYDGDALTVNPFLGSDGIKPFIEDCKKYDKGIFILVKTSNASSAELQDLTTDSGKKVHEVLAGLVEEWGSPLVGNCGYSSIGAVVGATFPEQARILRSIMKHAFILVPGYGAQGGTADDAARSFDNNGRGAIVNASRSIMCAYLDKKWKGSTDADTLEKAARAEALRMKEDLLAAINKPRS